MPTDALFKLEVLQKNIPHSYLISLFEGENQKIVPTSSVDIIGYKSIRLNDTLSIVIPKNEIISATRYFANSGIDYILSPFSILYEYIQDRSTINSLNVLIYNNVVYTIILNDLKEIVYSEVKTLTHFDDIQDGNFAKDDIVGQKLYEEVHFLEIQQFLNDVTQNYYEQTKNIDFLDKVEILYTFKPLSDEQMQSLYETIMVNIDYKAISIEDYVDSMIQKENGQIYNFIDRRAKKESANMFIWLLLALVSLSVVTMVIYYKMDDNTPKKIKQKKPIVKEVVKKVIKKPIIKIPIVKTPNHILLNNSRLQDIYMLFDIVPYDAVLKDLEINENDSTYVVNFIVNQPSLEDMRSKLLNIYKDSKILLKHNNKAILNTIIQNSTLSAKHEKIEDKRYNKYSFLSTSKATNYIKTLLPENSTIKYTSKDKTTYLKYNFTIKSLVKNPKPFFDFIEKLNKQNLSIIIEYPILFSKLNDKLEIKYKLSLYQQNKKKIKLNK
jgi:hypothetical protein